MFRRVQVAIAGRRPSGRQVHSAQPPRTLGPAIRWVHGSEALSRRMGRMVRRVRQTVARVARGGLVPYLRVRPSERSRDLR